MNASTSHGNSISVIFLLLAEGHHSNRSPTKTRGCNWQVSSYRPGGSGRACSLDCHTIGSEWSASVIDGAKFAKPYTHHQNLQEQVEHDPIWRPNSLISFSRSRQSCRL